MTEARVHVWSCRRFKQTRALRSPYWIGLEKPAGSNLYYWSDGSVVNNGNVSNADPCALRA